MLAVTVGGRSTDVSLTDLEAAALILVILQAESEVPLEGLAEELGLSDRQFGMGLGLLILEGKVRIRPGPGGFVVRLAAGEAKRLTRPNP
jgi:hypothetical protein